MSKPFPLGKLPADVLARLLEQFKPADPRVLVGPGLGLDAAVMEMGDRLLVAKSDPITFAADAIGWYAVQVNANDLATTGATPRWFLATVLLPKSRADAALAGDILRQIYTACAALGASLVGGHTEITYGLERPIVAGFMLGEVERRRLVTASGAQPGDVVIVTKGIAIEGTAIIARERGLAGFDDDFLKRCRRFLTEPGISVVRDAALALDAGGVGYNDVGHVAARGPSALPNANAVHAMHDPTEGGLATGLVELAQAAGVGLVIEERAVPVYAETRALCQALDLDPWGLIASGALLMAVEAACAENIARALEAQGIRAAVIGRVTEQAGQVLLRDSVTGSLRPVPHFERDEIARLFESVAERLELCGGC